jgi:hypothetical protein
LVGGPEARSSRHATCEEAAAAAWEFCDENELQMPSTDWYTNTEKYGKQQCFSVMVSKEDFDPQGEVRLEKDDSYIVIQRVTD